MISKRLIGNVCSACIDLIDDLFTGHATIAKRGRKLPLPRSDVPNPYRAILYMMNNMKNIMSLMFVLSKLSSHMLNRETAGFWPSDV